VSSRTARRSAVVIVIGLVVGIGFAIAGIGSSDSRALPVPPTTTTSTEPAPIGGDVGEPVIATAAQSKIEVPLGRVVVFSLGDPGAGRYLAASDDPAVFRVDNGGIRNGAGAVVNAGGRALAVGKTKVAVQYAGPGAPRPPVRFEITVTESAD